MSTNFSVLQGFGLFIKNDLGKREALSCQPGEIAEIRQTDGQTEVQFIIHDRGLI